MAELADVLIAEGFVPNEYLLDTNHTLEVPAGEALGDPWDLPSRLFRFPLEVQQRKDGKYHIGLMHIRLCEHPFVRRVQKAIRPHKIRNCGAPNQCGYTQAPATWWHAIDLISQWQALLRTAGFTTHTDIARAVVYALDYRIIYLPAARGVLKAIDVPEPEVRGRAASMRALFSEPNIVKPDKQAAYWPLNHSRAGHTNPGALAWSRIHGIEAGWFAYPKRGKGSLQWSESGRAIMSATAPTQLALPL